MPKYSVSEVLEILKNLTPQEKLELQQHLPSVLANAGATPQLVESHSQNIEGVNIGNSNSNIDFNQILADRGSNVSHNRTQTTVENVDLQAALGQLEKLKQDIASTNALNLIEKKVVEVPIKIVEEELKKPKPDKNLVDEAIATLQKGLAGVEALASPVMRVASLVAKAWVVL